MKMKIYNFFYCIYIRYKNFVYLFSTATKKNFESFIFEKEKEKKLNNQISILSATIYYITTLLNE